DIEFGGDVDAARGLVQQQYAWRSRDRAREHDLLLIAPAQSPYSLTESRGPQAHTPPRLGRLGALGSPVEKATQPDEPPQMRQRDIGSDVLRQQESLGAAFAWDIGDAATPTFSRSADADRLPCYRNGSASSSADQGLQKPVCAAISKACQSDN